VASFRYREIIMKIHQWLGLSSGLLVFLISISGVIYTFHEEIFDTIHAGSIHVESSGQPALPLDSLYINVQNDLGKQYPITYVNAYKEKDLAWQFRAYYFNPEKITYFFWCEYDYLLHVNPYTGEIIKKINYKYEFFQLVKMFHWSFWLRTDLGQPIVGWTVILFLVCLFAGVLWWWPRKSKFKKRHFTIRWKGISLVIYRDLHVVAGIFSLPVMVILALTGMVWAFKWFMALVYFAANLSFTSPVQPPGKPSVAGHILPDAYETIYRQSRILHPDAWSIAVYGANTENNTIATYVKNRKGVYYDASLETWDATRGEILTSRAFEKQNRGEKIISMNYDIHTGAVLGIWGKILIFFAGIVAAALPVTGFIVWLKKYRIRINN
jgi:uncharacterized iron-regulated membrane protein